MYLKFKMRPRFICGGLRGPAIQTAAKVFGWQTLSVRYRGYFPKLWGQISTLSLGVMDMNACCFALAYFSFFLIYGLSSLLENDKPHVALKS